MSILQLGELFGDCPISWQNMITYLQNGEERPVTDEEIQTELKKFNAVYHSPKSEFDFVKFDTEKDLVLYTLRWA